MNTSVDCFLFTTSTLVLTITICWQQVGIYQSSTLEISRAISTPYWTRTVSVRSHARRSRTCVAQRLLLRACNASRPQPIPPQYLRGRCTMRRGTLVGGLARPWVAYHHFDPGRSALESLAESSGVQLDLPLRGKLWLSVCVSIGRQQFSWERKIQVE